MITTIKNLPEYCVTCDNCGNEISFVSNQKEGATEYLICECYEGQRVIVNPSKGKHRMNKKPDTMRLREHIILKFMELRMPVMVRQMYYQLVGLGYPKTEEFYGKAQREILSMRQEGVLPYDLIIDSSRRRIKYQTFSTSAQALESWIRNYKQDVWKTLPVYVEIWLEKKSLQAIFADVCYEFDVPLCVSSGFSSESFIYESVCQMKAIGKPVQVFYFSDYDPSGLTLSKTVEDKIRRFGITDFKFERIALTPEQIQYYNLPTRPTKESTHSKGFEGGFEGDSCELDALDPRILVRLIRKTILSVIPESHMKNIKMEEDVNRQTLENAKLLMQA
jgi:hypothetical protein